LFSLKPASFLRPSKLGLFKQTAEQASKGRRLNYEGQVRETLQIWKRRAEIFRSMPLRSFLICLAGIGCLFGATGVLADSIRVAQQGRSALLFSLASGMGMSILWATAFLRWMPKTMLLVIILQFPVLNMTLTPYAYRHWSLTLAGPELRSAFVTHQLVALWMVIAGYICFIWFFRLEGRRFFAAHTEIKLASDIQRTLVPTIELQMRDFEFYGRSIPSGTVGGDLLDVITRENCFLAYVTDVAGHGVPAGVLMSMVKSAVRMRVDSKGMDDEGLLEALNNTLQPLTSATIYATFAYVASNGDGQIAYALAGHLPVLHFRKAESRIVRCQVENFPIALFPRVEYTRQTLTCEPGDILALITDGLTEVFDRSGNQLGIEHIERTLIEYHARPLSEIAAIMMRNCERFGVISDDRTLLLLRAKS
jgi:hypothetical protein